jgi:hypothetical protein
MAVGRPGTWLNVRTVPWLLALAGLAIPLVGSGFMVWPFVAVWLVTLALLWIFGRPALPKRRPLRIALAVGTLPLLFVAAWEGGWWLIPANVAWLAIEVATPAG